MHQRGLLAKHDGILYSFIAFVSLDKGFETLFFEELDCRVVGVSNNGVVPFILSAALYGLKEFSSKAFPLVIVVSSQKFDF